MKTKETRAMTHPFAPLMLAGLLTTELPSATRARLNRQALLEGRCANPTLIERLRALATPKREIEAEIAACATCA